LLAQAAFEDGQWAQAFPAFGVERRGAPVEAFARIDDRKIRTRTQVEEPDFVIVQDVSLLEYVDVSEGVDEDGTILLNTTADPDEVDIETEAKIVTVDATNIALEHIGVPIMNTSLLGAFASTTGLLSQESMETVIKRKFPGEKGDKNVAATTAAFEEVTA
jgi:pyruvate ferredoxin oxidoreductase gamma subunit